MFAFLLAYASALHLLSAFVILALMATARRSRYFFHAVKRVKWLVLIMVTAYAYTTPGEYLQHWFSDTRPTYEGLEMAWLQAIKLLTMLALLALLLGQVPRQVLLGGLCQLVHPLARLHMDARPFVMRLWLTLHYVETQQSNADASHGVLALLQQIAVVEQSTNEAIKHITIDVQPLRAFDVCQLVLILMIMLWVSL